MKRILNFSAVLALGLAQPGAWAQRIGDVPADVIVAAPQNYVVAARTLKLTARPVNGRGAVLRGRSLAWSVSDEARAKIDDSGLLAGLSPGPVDVTARDAGSGVSGIFRVSVYPGSVAINPRSATLDAGDTLKLTADVLDADGKAIAGASLQWSSDRPDVASITEGGMLTGVSEGRVTVAAGLDMGLAATRYSAYASVEVMHRSDFRVRNLLSTDTTTKGATALSVMRFSAAGEFAAAIVSLSNGGQAVLLSQSGRMQTLASTGGLLNGRPVSRFGSISVNNAGDVAILADTQAEWCEQMFVMFPAAAKWAPLILEDTTHCSYAQLPAASIDSKRNIVYRYANTLYYRKADGTRQTIVSIGDQAGGVSNIANILNWSVTPFGKVLAEVSNPAGTSVFLAWDGSALQRLFAVGDSITGLTSQWARLPAEVAPNVYISRVGGSNWSSISRFTNGTWKILASNGTGGVNWVQDNFDGADGSVFFVADTSGGTAVWRSDGTSLTKLATYPSWRDISGIAATGGDGVAVFGLLGEAVPRGVRLHGTSASMIVGPGVVVDGVAAPAIAQASIPKGVNLPNLILRTHGDTLLRITSSGGAPLIQPGDRLFSKTFAGLGSVAGNRLGDVAFTAVREGKTGLFTYSGGQFQMLADTDDKLSDNATINGFSTNDNQLAVNNQGHVAAWTYASGYSALVFYSLNAAGRPVIAFGGQGPGGGPLTGGFQTALDEGDRVAFIANQSNGKAGIFLWEQGKLRKLLEVGQNSPAGRPYQAFYSVQAAGNRFYVRAYSGVHEHLVLDGTTVQTIAGDGSVTSFGTVISNLFGMELAANSRGDVAMPVLTAAGPALLVKRADGTDALVAISSRRGPDNEWFLGLFGAGMGEQGDLIFSALGWLDGHPRLAIYQATRN